MVPTPTPREAKRTILSGELPDAAHVPTGCRFHPRCPALANGEAAEAGIDEHCTRTRLPVLEAEGEHRAACWLHQTPES